MKILNILKKLKPEDSVEFKDVKFTCTSIDITSTGEIILKGLKSTKLETTKNIDIKTKSTKLETTNDMDIKTKSMSLLCDEIVIQTKKVKVQSPDIEFGLENTQKLITQSLLLWLNTHVHTATSGLTGIPTSLATDEVLTKNVKAS